MANDRGIWTISAVGTQGWRHYGTTLGIILVWYIINSNESWGGRECVHWEERAGINTVFSQEQVVHWGPPSELRDNFTQGKWCQFDFESSVFSCYCYSLQCAEAATRSPLIKNVVQSWTWVTHGALKNILHTFYQLKLLLHNQALTAWGTISFPSLCSKRSLSWEVLTFNSFPTCAIKTIKKIIKETSGSHSFIPVFLWLVSSNMAK